uniref:Uncharacterized protein n=1 Tax=Rhizophora mucronata TaxID=61149 RepID=A0A2P2N407_RHIMU
MASFCDFCGVEVWAYSASFLTVRAVVFLFAKVLIVVSIYAEVLSCCGCLQCSHKFWLFAFLPLCCIWIK